MDAKKLAALNFIDEKADVVTKVSDAIWEYAELSLMEHQSAALYEKVLRENGFEVETNIAGIETAFTGTYGSGAPVIGILAEFDALTGLSQKPGVTIREELKPGGNGHGCGHHLLGGGALAAAFGVKKYLQETGREGTVIFYGCPGEEGGASKAFMARDGIFKTLDAAITWHPASVNEIRTGTCVSCIQKEYRFTGVASHAAGAPHLGRSALDAVELMNIGVQFLREHMPSTARIHYAITNAGGNSPNVVQPTAKVLYMVRDVKVRSAVELQARVDKIAEAAAMMTDTQLTVRFIDGTANTVPNFTIEKLMYDNFEALGVPTYTDEERAFAKKMTETYENKPDGLPGFASQFDEQIADYVREKTDNGATPLNDFLMPYFASADKPSAGSTDVGDVSWLTPTAQLGAVTWASNSPGHSWQNVAMGKTTIAHKGMLCAGKVMAATAIDLFESPEMLKTARAEFEKRAAEGYYCPIPADAVPTTI